MLRKTNDITGYTLLASDGEIGRCQDFLFDDRSHAIRYMVAKTAKWLPGRKVVLSPAFLERPDYARRLLPLRLTRKQIEESPPLDEHAPVSRQYESQFHEYYALPFYWTGPGPWTVHPNDDGALLPVSETGEKDSAEDAQAGEEGHLRSTNEVGGYYIEAVDGEIGHAQDFLVDDVSWTLRYLVIDTRNWLPGRHVLVSMPWLKSVRWADRTIQVDLTRAAIENSPEYDPNRPLEREDEIALHRHYDRPFDRDGEGD